MNMKRLALIAATGCLAFVLTACGEQGNKQPTPAPNDTNAATPTQPAQNQPAADQEQNH